MSNSKAYYLCISEEQFLNHQFDLSSNNYSFNHLQVAMKVSPPSSNSKIQLRLGWNSVPVLNYCVFNSILEYLLSKGWTGRYIESELNQYIILSKVELLEVLEVLSEKKQAACKLLQARLMITESDSDLWSVFSNFVEQSLFTE